MIFVLNKNKNPLSPCHEAVARKLLKTGKAVIPKGKYKGILFGAVACRKTGSFDIKNKDGVRIAQGINHKYCNILSRADGYEYTLNGLEVDSVLPYLP